MGDDFYIEKLQEELNESFVDPSEGEGVARRPNSVKGVRSEVIRLATYTLPGSTDYGVRETKETFLDVRDEVFVANHLTWLDLLVAKLCQGSCISVCK